MNKLILSISLVTLASMGISNCTQNESRGWVEPQAAWIPVKQNFSLRSFVNSEQEGWTLVDLDECEFIEYKLDQHNHACEGAIWQQKWKLKAPSLGFYNLTFQRGTEIQIACVYVFSIDESI